MAEQLSGKLLVVDDEPLMCGFIHDLLNAKGYKVITANNGLEALDILKRDEIVAVITDVKMPKMSGSVLLKKIRELSPNIPVVLVTGYGTIDNAVAAMKQGAVDYLSKPLSAEKLHEVVERSILNYYNSGNFPTKIITDDPQMLRILETVETIANNKASVFIQGESGTGKELIARAIHERSGRRNNHFVAVNCAALPESLLESELFGHEQGSFTGAVSRRIGKFESAHQGTLLLDEIAEMAPSLQVKLLRVLQEGELDRIGGDRPVEIDVRTIATTNKRIREEIKKGTFRDDLFYRLCVVEITIPPLRERKGDIKLLLDYFLNKYTQQHGKPSLKVPRDVIKALEKHYWPGNVRELENSVERAVMLCRDDVLSIKNFFPAEISTIPTKPISDLEGNTLRDVEKQLILSTLEKAGGNKTRAAEILGITSRTIRNKLQQYEEEDN
jgi:DNA-binding NtrC family response regulator